MKTGMAGYVFLIPAYEPDEALIEVLRQLNGAYAAVVVNDGSGASCDPVFEEASRYAHVISYEENHGKGYALKTGLSYIREHYREYIVVTMDSDGQHRVEDALTLLAAAEEDRGALILGQRTWEKDMPFKSRLGNGLTRGLFRMVSGQKIYDTQTGLRAFSCDLTDYMLGIRGDRYEYEMNVLLNLKDAGIPVREIPIETIYIDDNKGTHYHALRDSAIILREILLFIASSFSSFLIDYALFALLLFLKLPVTAANVLARLVSASYNYMINKRVVFRSGTRSSLAGYVCLAAGILALNTALLNLLIFLGVNQYLAKICTEIVLFFVNYQVQKKLIFRKDDHRV